MSDWIKAINPKATIGDEAEALRAARASAISIFIGVIAGAVSALWTLTQADAVAAAVAAGGDGVDPATVQASIQAGLWVGVGLVAVQLVFAIIQWRDPKKFIAILFLVLIAFGFVSLLATPMLAGLAPEAPPVPLWQMILSGVILVVQAILHVRGLGGVKRLDEIQTAAAR